MMKPIQLALSCLLTAGTTAAMAQNSIPSFKATSLIGETVTEQRLLGQPAVLIVTPSRGAAEGTKQWAEALRKNIPVDKVRVRDVIALDLPFFMSEQDALAMARKKIPIRYHNQTWLMNEGPLEKALNVPRSSENAFVFVLDSQGKVVARASGQPTQAALQEIRNAVKELVG